MSSPAAFAFYDPDSSSWKTYAACLPLGMDDCSDRFSGTWPTSGWMHAGRVYEQPTWVHPTADTECSSSPILPTPSVSDGAGGHINRSGDRRGELLLPGGVRTLLPTPSLSMAERGGQHPDQRKTHTVNLQDAIIPLLPTPTNAVDSGSRNLPGSKAHLGVSLTDAVLYGNSNTPRTPIGDHTALPSPDGSTPLAVLPLLLLSLDEPEPPD